MADFLRARSSGQKEERMKEIKKAAERPVCRKTLSYDHAHHHCGAVVLVPGKSV